MAGRTVSNTIVVVLATISSACSMTAMMIPVEGPMSEVRPVPTLNVFVQGINSNSGKLSFTMPDGDKCAGRWGSAAGSGLTVGAGSLIGQYGSTYLSGFSISAGRGQNPGQALMTCEKGRTVQLEFVTGAGTAHGYGIGKDNEGNIFRFVF